MQTAKASSCNHIKRRWVTANHKALMTDSTCEKFLLRAYSANEEPGKCKGLLWQKWRGDLYYNQDQSCGNESRGYLDLTDQPASKITSFFMAQWILHTQAGRKSTALPNLTVVLKRNAKALYWETKTFVNKDWRAMWKLQMQAAIQNWLPFSLWVWMELAKPQRNNVNI